MTPPTWRKPTWSNSTTRAIRELAASRRNLRAGHAPNALPQRAEANVNCRIFPGVKTADVQAELQAVAGKEVKVELASGGNMVGAEPPARRCSHRLSQMRLRSDFPGTGIVPMDVGWCNRRRVHSCGGHPDVWGWRLMELHRGTGGQSRLE